MTLPGASRAFVPNEPSSSQDPVATPTSRTANHALEDLYGPSQSGLPIAWWEGRPVAPKMGGSFNVQMAVKRALDIVLAAGGIFFLGPFLIIVAIIICADGSPALFRQKRLGLHGEVFEILKFRSMRVKASDETGSLRTCAEDDDRITPIGRLIRRTSIDELPQLFNVLGGSMSLVGPRPHIEGMLAAGRRYDELVEFYAYRHMVKPGLTGWAQCNGLRGPTSDEARAVGRIAHDVAYIQNFSLLLDLKCIARTLRNEFIGGSGL